MVPVTHRQWKMAQEVEAGAIANDDEFVLAAAVAVQCAYGRGYPVDRHALEIVEAFADWA
ncbi:MAG TPA: hypothetical protein VMA37_17480 [Acetobacteraceae bacterium]|nr:hypothetical protein [Acetobacteraceae bacterium]